MDKSSELDSYWYKDALHVRKNEVSENGPLFTAEYHMIQHLLGKSPDKNRLISAIVDTGTKEDPETYLSHTRATTNHFSHDNMTGLYVLLLMAGMSVKGMPISKWNDRWWLHPRDLIFYSLMQEKKWSLVLLPLLYLVSIVSCSSERSRTSGKMLWWLRLHVLEMRGFRSSRGIIKLCESVMRLRGHGKNPWLDAAKIYFPSDHPIVTGMEELYGRD